jgi:hypothetical protein
MSFFVSDFLKGVQDYNNLNTYIASPPLPMGEEGGVVRSSSNRKISVFITES